MRGKRSKQYRKLMQTYQLTFGFREPYQILLSASIIKDAARYKMQLGHMLSNTLHGEIKPMITQCCIRHLYTAEAKTPDEKAEKEKWIEVAKQAERRRCGHHELEEPLGELECINSVLDPKGGGSNKHKYVVATQELEVRQAMREIAGVPLIYINRSVMILEPMAARSTDVREADEKGKIRAGLKGRRGGETQKRKREDGEDGEEGAGEGATAELEPMPKKKKSKGGPKGPNPLSVKKPKAERAKQQPKSVGREIEDERSAIRRAAKSDPQAAEKALGAESALGVGPGVPDGSTEAAKKRKRKRKPKDAAARGEGEATLDAAADDSN